MRASSSAILPYSGINTFTDPKGLYLPDDPQIRQQARELSDAGRLHIEELRRGLVVRSTSFVGRITLGDIEITIEPKIAGMPLMRLLQYAYGLRDITLYDRSGYSVSSLPFSALLLRQLELEVEQLLRRGLRREYTRQDALLASPRGRIDIRRFAGGAASFGATLPCTYYPRVENTLLNQVLLAGLRLGMRLTADLQLRGALATKSRLLAEELDTITLNRQTLQKALRACSRLTAAYLPALALIELLVSMLGATLEGEARELQIPGFLFDMNRFFQTLLSRFLSDNLPGYMVRDEHRLAGMLRYDPQHNPRGRRAPEPRPDFAILQQGRLVALLDAKYRDLWERSLPRDMLYQLAIYALSQRDRREAAILYPTLDPSAVEARIAIRDPIDSTRAAHVILRPVPLLELSRLVTPSTAASERIAYARRLAFGTGP